MKKIILSVVTALSFAGCAATGGPATDVAARFAQDSACALILANQGVQIAAGVSAADALAIISAASKQPEVATACAGLINNLQQDVQGAAATLKGAAPAAPAAPAGK